MLARLLPDEKERAAFIRWAGIALAVHLVAAVLTEGWYSNDEHWQILEFASAILGRIPRDVLPWEYASRMRPSIQPYFYAGIERVLYGIGIDNPFTIATVLRVLTSMCAWSATMLAGIVGMRWLEGSPVRRWVMPTLALAWFLPFIHARTSSENASETAFIFGFSLLALKVEAPVLIGGLFGLACEFRFQTGFMVIGALLWCAFIARVPIRTLVKMAVGLLLAVAVCTAADRVFYGGWTFTPWNYVRVNVIEHQANKFGTSPWWNYFRTYPERLGPPIGFVFVGLVFFGWFRQWRSLTTFCMVPFLLAHVATSHKETRFLFPLATLALLTALVAADDVLRTWPRIAGWWRHRAWRMLVYLMLAENIGLLAIASLRPAQAVMPMYRKIYEISSSPLTLYYRDKQLYHYEPDLVPRFYMPAGLSLGRISSLDELKGKVSSGPIWFVEPGLEFPAGFLGSSDQCTAVDRTFPLWLRKFNFNRWMDRSPLWTLNSCKRPVLGDFDH